MFFEDQAEGACLAFLGAEDWFAFIIVFSQLILVAADPCCAIMRAAKVNVGGLCAIWQLQLKAAVVGSLLAHVDKLLPTSDRVQLVSEILQAWSVKPERHFSGVVELLPKPFWRWRVVLGKAVDVAVQLRNLICAPRPVLQVKRHRLPLHRLETGHLSHWRRDYRLNLDHGRWLVLLFLGLLNLFLAHLGLLHGPPQKVANRVFVLSDVFEFLQEALVLDLSCVLRFLCQNQGVVLKNLGQVCD